MNDGTGFEINNSSQNTLTGNTANNNGFTGFNFNNSSSNTVTGNAAFHNGAVGFCVVFDSQYNVSTQNSACQNFFVDAADISTAAGHTWTNNTFCTTEGI